MALPNSAASTFELPRLVVPPKLALAHVMPTAVARMLELDKAWAALSYASDDRQPPRVVAAAATGAAIVPRPPPPKSPHQDGAASGEERDGGPPTAAPLRSALVREAARFVADPGSYRGGARRHELQLRSEGDAIAAADERVERAMSASLRIRGPHSAARATQLPQLARTRAQLAEHLAESQRAEHGAERRAVAADEASARARIVERADELRALITARCAALAAEYGEELLRDAVDDERRARAAASAEHHRATAALRVACAAERFAVDLADQWRRGLRGFEEVLAIGGLDAFVARRTDTARALQRVGRAYAARRAVGGARWSAFRGAVARHYAGSADAAGAAARALRDRFRLHGAEALEQQLRRALADAAFAGAAAAFEQLRTTRLHLAEYEGRHALLAAESAALRGELAPAADASRLALHRALSTRLTRILARRHAACPHVARALAVIQRFARAWLAGGARRSHTLGAVRADLARVIASDPAAVVRRMRRTLQRRLRALEASGAPPSGVMPLAVAADSARAAARSLVFDAADAGDAAAGTPPTAPSSLLASGAPGTATVLAALDAAPEDAPAGAAVEVSPDEFYQSVMGAPPPLPARLAEPSRDTAAMMCALDNGRAAITHRALASLRRLHALCFDEALALVAGCRDAEDVARAPLIRAGSLRVDDAVFDAADCDAELVPRVRTHEMLLADDSHCAVTLEARRVAAADGELDGVSVVLLPAVLERPRHLQQRALLAPRSARVFLAPFAPSVVLEPSEAQWYRIRGAVDVAPFLGDAGPAVAAGRFARTLAHLLRVHRSDSAGVRRARKRALEAHAVERIAAEAREWAARRALALQLLQEHAFELLRLDWQRRWLALRELSDLDEAATLAYQATQDFAKYRADVSGVLRGLGDAAVAAQRERDYVPDFARRRISARLAEQEEAQRRAIEAQPVQLQLQQAAQRVSQAPTPNFYDDDDDDDGSDLGGGAPAGSAVAGVGDFWDALLAAQQQVYAAHVHPQQLLLRALEQRTAAAAAQGEAADAASPDAALSATALAFLDMYGDDDNDEDDDGTDEFSHADGAAARDGPTPERLARELARYEDIYGSAD
jgi:hypothetical protein